MLTFYNAIANEGVMVKPLFTSQILKDGKIVTKQSKEIINPAICSKSSINEIVPYLIDVVEKGTAKNIKSSEYKIAGKTGTSLIAYGKSAELETKRYRASFVGFFPANKPKYSCIVVVHNPKENGFYGSDVAAPVFKEISDKIYASDISIHEQISIDDYVKDFPYISQGKTEETETILDYLNLTYSSTSSEWMTQEYSRNKLKLNTRNIDKDFENGIMPNLYGMNLMDAIYLLENAGLKVSFSGSGHVINQSIKKGKNIKINEEIKLRASL